MKTLIAVTLACLAAPVFLPGKDLVAVSVRGVSFTQDFSGPARSTFQQWLSRCY
jgi:hypothetical protein